ncbi:MAG: TldD/PmbA family protein [candidate division Zixibacteria bacterium]|nr:TldD/PmbA family protein [candidate division Zixibacteria bacterium]
MEKLLELAKKVSDKAEVYSTEYTYSPVSFENAKLHEINSTFQSGLSLRIIKDGKLGFAYTCNLINREEFLQNALDSLKGGVEAGYDFPLTENIRPLDTYDPSLENLTGTQMVAECDRVSDILKVKTDAELSLTSFKHIEKIRIMNSEGTDISERSSFYGLFGQAIFPGSGSGIYRYYQSKNFGETPDSYLNEIIDGYNIAAKPVEPSGGKMKVIFMPNSMITLNWRILSGLNSKSVYEKTSPIADKLNQKIFDEKITIYSDPTNTEYPGARAFDDEGVPGAPLALVESGELKSFFYDLNFACKLNAVSTGHGYKTTQWGGDAITLKPTPALPHMRIKTGDKSFAELVKSIDRGVIIEGALGAHSGNIPNGDYSIGVSPGLYVENGEIIGRVKEAMISGNIYDTLKNVVDIGDTLYPTFSGAWVPPILFDNVSVATKK